MAYGIEVYGAAGEVRMNTSDVQYAVVSKHTLPSISPVGYAPWYHTHLSNFSRSAGTTSFSTGYNHNIESLIDDAPSAGTLVAIEVPVGTFAFFSRTNGPATVFTPMQNPRIVVAKPMSILAPPAPGSYGGAVYSASGALLWSSERAILNIAGPLANGISGNWFILPAHRQYYRDGAGSGHFMTGIRRDTSTTLTRICLGGTGYGNQNNALTNVPFTGFICNVSYAAVP